MISEAVLYQYAYFASSLHGAGGQVRHAADSGLPGAIKSAVAQVYQWLGREAPPVALAAEDFIANGGPGERRLHPPPGQPSRWVEQSPWAAYADVSQSHDTVRLLLAYSHSGQVGVDTWARLGQGPAPSLDQQAFYLGQTLCYGGRVASLEAARAAAEQVLVSDPDSPRLTLRQSDLPGGLWLFDRPGLADRLALFYPDTDQAEAAAAGYFNAILPPLLLYLHKLAHHYTRIYQAGLRVSLQASEQALAQMLEGAGPPKQTLSELETQLRGVAEAYNSFAAHYGAFEQVQQVARVNLLNLRQSFTEHNLPRTGPLAGRLAAAERALQQMEADEGFWHALEHRTQMALAALQVQADVERGQIEMRENQIATQRNLLPGFLATVLAFGEIIGDATAEAFIGWVSPLLGRAAPQTVGAGWLVGVRFFLVLTFGAAFGTLVAAIILLFDRLNQKKMG